METNVEIRAAFQPIFNTLEGNVALFETNLRIDGSIDKQFHLRLLSLSEQLGFTHFFDLHMLKMVCGILQERSNVLLSTNIAQSSISAEFERLVACIRDSPASKKLIIEITESSWCSRGMISDFCRQIRAEDCQIAVDDYGQGFCDLELVEAVQPDIIKIVLSDDNDGNRAKIKETMKLATQIKALVVVERVDTVQKVRLAEEFGVNFMQGFILAKPMTLLDVNEAMKMTVEQSLVPHLVEKRPVEIIRRVDTRITNQAAIASR